MYTKRLWYYGTAVKEYEFIRPEDDEVIYIYIYIYNIYIYLMILFKIVEINCLIHLASFSQPWRILKKILEI